MFKYHQILLIGAAGLHYQTDSDSLSTNRKPGCG